MSAFSQLSQGMQDQLAPLGQMAGVALVQEDVADIETEIAKAEGEVGMLVLLGTPGFANEDPLAGQVNARLKIEVLIREVPAVWRVAGNANPIHCSDLGQLIATTLQALFIPGFQPLRVLRGESLGSWVRKAPDAEPAIFQDYLVEIETMQIFGA